MRICPSLRAIKGKAEMTKYNRMVEALKIVERFNPLRNDLDTYLFVVIEWAQGKGAKPDPKEFGIEEEKQECRKNINLPAVV